MEVECKDLGITKCDSCNFVYSCRWNAGKIFLQRFLTWTGSFSLILPALQYMGRWDRWPYLCPFLGWRKVTKNWESRFGAGFRYTVKFTKAQLTWNLKVWALPWKFLLNIIFRLQGKHTSEVQWVHASETRLNPRDRVFLKVSLFRRLGRWGLLKNLVKRPQNGCLFKLMSKPKVERGVTLHILYSTPLAETFHASFNFDESSKKGICLNF